MHNSQILESDKKKRDRAKITRKSRFNLLFRSDNSSRNSSVSQVQNCVILIKSSKKDVTVPKEQF